MMRTGLRAFKAPPLALALLLAACGGEAADPAASIEGAWVRLPAAPGAPGGGYFTATLGRGDAITAVSSPSAERIEMHDVVEENGVTRMVAMPRVEQEGREPIRFAPGGKHLMIFGLDPALRPQATIELNFTFAEAPPLTVRAQVTAPGSSAPGHGH